MDITKYYAIEGEKPLDEIKPNGGMTSIFRTIGCIGDSMSSGEHESLDENGKVGWNDYFEYSWGQYMARAIGSKVYNFSRGGMTAKEYCESFAEARDFWNPEYACQAYIMAMGVNDLNCAGMELGTIDDIDLENPENNKPTIAGWYGKIIQKYREISPKCRFFLVTVPKSDIDSPEWAAKVKAFIDLLYQMADLFEFTYIIDLYKDAPVFDKKFKENFYLAGHMNAAGYRMIALMVMSYIDYIIRNNPADFAQVGFIGKGGIHNTHAKW